MVKRLLLLFPAISVLQICVSGCGDNAYSAAMRYDVRTDPLVLDEKGLGDERPNPDPPGQLPLFTPADVKDPRNPYYRDGKGMELFTGAVPKLRDPMELPSSERKRIGQALDQVFGTPREPQVRVFPEQLGVQLEVELKLGPQTLAEGSRLYRLHCLHCHGLTGDGRGPTSKWVNPHPRDYRQGLFKFQSVNQLAKQDRKPSRQDLYRTLHQGIEGTSMPAFNLLPSEELEALVSYVIHLSMRGEIEYSTMKNGYELKDGKLVPTETYPDPVATLLPKRTEQIAKAWLDAQGDSPENAITPGDYPFDESAEDYQEKMGESVRRGEAIFLADDNLLKKYFPKDLAKVKAASCVACHKDYGRQAEFKFDKWGTLVRAANLTRGVYRGGRRPIDIYYRIHSGINGSGMLMLGNDLQPEQIWDVVNFVRILPYQKMREAYRVVEYRDRDPEVAAK